MLSLHIYDRGERVLVMTKHDVLLETVRIACARCVIGRQVRPMMLLGRNEVGKAALLGQMVAVAEANQLLRAAIAFDNRSR